MSGSVSNWNSFSENGLPPMTGWKSVDNELAGGTPTIE